jgi:hypothetical protein
VIALVVSALIAGYLLVPNALFRFVLGRFVPLRVFQDRKTEDLTRAVVTLAFIYVAALLTVWYVPGCNGHPFRFPDDASLRVSDYETVAGGLYSEELFRQHQASFWDAAWRSLERQGRLIFWYYCFVVVFAMLAGWATKHYGKLRRIKTYVWLADFYLLPHISQWYALLTPFTFSDNRTVVKADVLMTDNTLYRGDVADHFLDKDGNLSGLFLANPRRFDRVAYLREKHVWQSGNPLVIHPIFGDRFQAPNFISLQTKLLI